MRPRLLIPSLLVLAWCGRAGAERYTLPALMARVQRESPSVVAARATVAMRRAQVLEQQLRWLPEGETGIRAVGVPNVNCTPDPFNECRTTDVVDLVRSQPGLSLEDRAPFSGISLSWTAALRQPLFTSMKIENAIASAKGGVGVSEADLGTAEVELAVNVVRVFTQIKTARAVMATTDTAIGVVHNYVSYVEREIDGKNVAHYTESDRIRLRLLSRGMEGSLLDQRRNLNAALEALRLLTNDPDADVDASELDWEDRSIPPQAWWRERMLDERPEMKYGRAGLRYYDAYRRLQIGWALPDLAFITSLGWGFSAGLRPTSSGYLNQPASALTGTLAFGIRQPLDFGPKLAHFYAVDHEREQQRTRFRLGIAWWTVEVDKAWLDLEEARRRLAENKHGESLTQGWYALVDENVALGLSPDGRELLEVILNWSGFRNRRLQAVADTMVALATLRRLSGVPVLDGGAL
jgi:outer membrane protein TolC